MAKSSNAYFYLLQSVWQYAQNSQSKIVLFYILSILANLVELSEPYFIGRAVASLGFTADKRVSAVAIWLGFYVAANFFTWILHGISRVLEHNVALNISYQFKDTLYYTLTALPLGWHQKHHSGNTIHRVRLADEALYLFSKNQFSYIRDVLVFVAPIFFLSTIDWKLAIGVVLFAAILFAICMRFDKHLTRLYTKINTLQHHYSEALHDYVSNISTILALRLGERTRRELYNRALETYPDFKKEIVLNEWKWFCIDFPQSLIIWGVMIYFVWSQNELMGEAATVGVFVMCLQYLQRFASVFYGFAERYGILIHSRADLAAIEPILEDYETWTKQNQLSEQEVKEPLSLDWKKIEIRGLYFTYEDREHHRHQFRGLSLHFKRGERIALVGASGAGKSTLLTLLRGLYQPADVEVWVDNRKREEGLAALSSLTTLIPQEPEIFENTILYNITVGIPYTEQELEEVIRVACFDQVVKELPQGMNTDIREKGVNLSGGQKQRLALARGLFAAKESSILLLDEPTSSVDSLTEAQIYKNIFASFKNVTVISSIHRLHLLELFDWVYVMEEGKAMEQGSFQELIAKRGYFYSIWNQYLEQRMQDGVDEK